VSPGGLFSQNAFVFSSAARGLRSMPVCFLRANLRFNFCSYARFQLGVLANLGFRPEPVFFFRLPECMGLSLAACFLSAISRAASQPGGGFFIRTMSGFCFRETTSLLSREPLRLPPRHDAGLLLGDPARVLFGLAALRRFRAH